MDPEMEPLRWILGDLYQIKALKAGRDKICYFLGAGTFSQKKLPETAGVGRDRMHSK